MTSRSKVAVVTSMRAIVLQRRSRAVAPVTAFWQATRMNWSGSQHESRPLTRVLGTAGVAALAGAFVWLALGTGPAVSTVEEEDSPLIGYAPTAPATGKHRASHP